MHRRQYGWGAQQVIADRLRYEGGTILDSSSRSLHHARMFVDPDQQSRSRRYVLAFWAFCAFLLVPGQGWAGGGVMLRDDVCIITIGFYEAHFTAYQPQTRGNEEFCKDLPDIGETLFVLDYLHASMKEVPIDFRIIKDVTELGQFVQLRDIEAIADLDAHTVFYQRPTVRTDASLRVDHSFVESGEYVGIVTAGHPTQDTIYTAVFPFRVGKTDYSRLMWLGLLLLVPFGYYFARRGGAPVPNGPNGPNGDAETS